MLMKQLATICMCVALAFSGCTSQGNVSGDPTAVMLGAQIGGLTGAVIGSSGSHTYRGSLIGSLVGTIAGAAIASAATSAVEDDGYTVETRVYDYEDDYAYERPRRIRRHDDRYDRRDTELAIRNIRFIDDNRNHVIESGERAKIIFEVVNTGRVAAYHVTPVVAEKNGLKNISISSSVTLECIPAGDGIRYTAVVHAGKMRSGEAVFHITALDGRGGMVPVWEFVIPVRR